MWPRNICDHLRRAKAFGDDSKAMGDGRVGGELGRSWVKHSAAAKVLSDSVWRGT